MAAAGVVSVSMGAMNSVLAKLGTLVADKLKGLGKEVYFLRRELGDMEALLEKMDNADELDPQAKNWRKDIINLSYDIEDCIDDFMQRVGEPDDKMGIFRKASHYLRTFKDRWHIANQFKEIKTKVIEVSERQKRYMFDQSISSNSPVAVDPRLSAIYKDSTSIVGIDAQKTELVNLAMDGEQQLKVMAIVGFGGLGKTTLANEMYREVGGKFDCKAFVSVSQKPEMIGLFNSLLLQHELRTYSHACQVQDPINKLRGHLQDKRYFIVVDDLWDTKAWNTIKLAFPQNNKCSRVMLTTRDKNVARSCCGNLESIHNMRPLSEQDSKKLFFDRIFGSEDDCPLDLKKASSEILKKCAGAPLAIITMASMLACQTTRLEGQWEYIKNSLASRSAINSNYEYEDMMYILDLSYKHLPGQLKSCFLYLGSYPEDHVIHRAELVRRWVAEGFVSNSVGQDVWDVAERYFNELVNRSMIQPTYDMYKTVILGCRVHDMLLDLIARRCKEDNFLSLVNGPQVAEEAQDKVIRRLNVVGLQGADDDKVTITNDVNLAHIRSFTIMRESNWIPSFLDLKFVRVLSLDLSPFGEMAIDLTIINQLLQLRYLKVRGDGINITLPSQIRGLRLLETLDLSSILGGSISLEIVDAPHLSHLLMPRDTIMSDLIGKVKSLHTLCGIMLPLDPLESIIRLGELTSLSNLEFGFPAKVSSKATWMTALSTSLDKLSNLKRLYVSAYYRPAIALCPDVLSSISPPFRNLEDLYLFGCTFSRVPKWIAHLCNLHRLHVAARQVLQEDVDIIGIRLPSLVYLSFRIPGISAETIMIQDSTGFPALKRFRFDCDGTSFLMFGAGAMPELQVLEVVLDVAEWDKAAIGGLQHLMSLEEITIFRACYNSKRRRRPKATDEDDVEVDVALIRSVFQEAADALPHLTLDLGQREAGRPVEEEDYVEEEEDEWDEWDAPRSYQSPDAY